MGLGNLSGRPHGLLGHAVGPFFAIDREGIMTGYDALPEFCYYDAQDGSRAIIVIKRGEMGFHPNESDIPEGMTPAQLAHQMNLHHLHVDDATATIMVAASMNRWDIPAVANYVKTAEAPK